MPPNTPTQSDQLPEIVERLNAASNVLITVSSDPSIDQLAACIGLTLALNKQGKHATAVFSGMIPPTLEFLKPEHTIEKNTNSLRDFIISLDKSKADKLRYKVEDDFVKIFITPYRTSIDEKDFAFSQGDFNIDLIVTLGVHERAHLDAAIIAHGRILHDAAVVSINTTSAESEIGAINWLDTTASSLCEMTSDLVIKLDKELLDEQIATALLTGMVAETDRFGNDKASPNTMSVSGVLMAAGASPQLISSELREPEPEPEPEPEAVEPDEEIPAVVEPEPEPEPQPEEPDDGTIEIDHSQDDNIVIDQHGKLEAVEELENTQPDQPDQPDQTMMSEPPRNDVPFSATSLPIQMEDTAAIDPLMQPPSPTPWLDRTQQSDEAIVTPPQSNNFNDQTIADLEYAVESPHIQDLDQIDDQEPVIEVPPPPPVDDARAAVEQVVESVDNYRPEPINALGATPIDLDLGHEVKDEPPSVPPPLMPPPPTT